MTIPDRFAESDREPDVTPLHPDEGDGETVDAADDSPDESPVQESRNAPARSFFERTDVRETALLLAVIVLTALLIRALRGGGS